MHQIYSCSDENLEVFTTVISSKCEYIGTIMLGAVLSLDGRRVLSLTKPLKGAAHLSVLLAPRCAASSVLAASFWS